MLILVCEKKADKAILNDVVEHKFPAVSVSFA